MPPSDIELIQAVQRGDRRAFEHLVLRYRQPLYNFIIRYTGDVNGADDLTQEVFLNAWKAAPRFRIRPDAGVSSWLFSIARNLAKNEIKRRIRFNLFRFNLLNWRRTSDDSEDSDVHLKEAETAITELMAQLPENQRAALILRVFHELSYREISEALGISVSGVESLIFRARKYLKERLLES